MTLGPLTNPRWQDAAQTKILLDTTWNGEANTFLAVADDVSDNGRAIHAAALAGEFGTIAAYVAPAATPRTPEQLRAAANAKVAALRATARAYALPGGASVASDATAATLVDLVSLIGGPASWIDNAGAVTPLTAEQVAALAQAVRAYSQSVFAILAQAMPQIAGGAITTTAQIDALAWPF